MAEKTGGKEAGEERILNVPLRKEWLKVPKNERGKRALHALRWFVSRHTKSYEIRISQKVNEMVWVRGVQKPPQSIRVKVSVSEGKVSVMLPEESEKRPEVKEEKKGLGRLKETLEKEKGLPGLGGPKEEILKRGRKKEKKSRETKTGKKEKKPRRKE
jgi:large subunit ribosomal protein L31e